MPMSTVTRPTSRTNANAACKHFGIQQLVKFTCQYDENSHQEGGQQKREQYSAKGGSAVFASFAAGFHNGCGHGRQEDETHILHLPYCKGEGAFDAEDELMHATAQEHKLHHLPKDWLEKMILQSGKSSREENKRKEKTKPFGVI